MSTNASVPQKEDIPKEVWRLATTLSDEMQDAAIRKSRELGFDEKRGRIPLQETLVNLGHDRDAILGVVHDGNLVQLPLKLQFLLHAQLQKISELLNSLVSGTDSLLALEDAVDDLTGTVWQYNLRNLSSDVFGFESKMNQLKAQEVQIRQAQEEVVEFRRLKTQVDGVVTKIDEARKEIDEGAGAAKALLDQISASATKAAENEQRLSALLAQGQQHDASSAQYAAAAKTAAAEVEALASRTKALQPELDAARSSWTDLSNKAAELLRDSEKRVSSSLADYEQKCEQLKADAETQSATLREELSQAGQQSAATVQTKLDSALSEIQRLSSEADERVSQSLVDADARLSKSEGVHEKQLIAQLTENAQKSDEAITKNNAEFSRLSKELDALEGRIKGSIERATGYTLFHSFQKRQEDLAKSKWKWGIALAGAVLVSLLASGAFIYSLQYVKVYNAAFYLKLSIALPLVYAVAFCNVQYSRERRLEEEYAFKSSISISLDPYQKLVAQLVDKEKPEERLKFAEFVIESVNRVFTSPTGKVFGDETDSKNSAEKIIKAVGDVVEPLAKAIKK